MKMLMALINKTANKMITTKANKIALIGEVTELTWRRILITLSIFCMANLIPHSLQEYKPLSVIM